MRLFVIAHAATDATRRAAFPADDPIEDKARTLTTALAGRLPAVTQVLASPALAARQTAAILSPSFVETPELADADYGRWAGLTLDAVSAADPAGVAAWLSDPDAVPHGGESLAGLIARVGAWLDDESWREDGRHGGVLAVTHAAVVRAAVVHLLGAPAQAFWRIDVAPLGLFELRRSGGPWTLRAMRPQFGTDQVIGFTPNGA